MSVIDLIKELEIEPEKLLELLNELENFIIFK